MPYRRTPLISGQIYHIYNRSLDGRRVFQSQKVANHFLELLKYYRSTKATSSYSCYQSLEKIQNESLTKILLFKKYFRVKVLAYCLMPTHFHLLMRQEVDSGISKYISDSMNAFTRFFNIKSKRKGPLFLPRFQAKLIYDREQLIHVSRYIHLNPYSSGNIQNLEDILSYPNSSMKEYLSEKIPSGLSDSQIILSEFQNNKHKYLQFILENADYHRALEVNKYT